MTNNNGVMTATELPWFLVKGGNLLVREVSVRLLLLALLEDQGQPNKTPRFLSKFTIRITSIIWAPPKKKINHAPMSDFHSLSTYVDSTKFKSYFPRQLHHLPACISGFFGEKKTSSVLFLPPTTKMIHMLIPCHWLVVALLSAVRFRHRTPSYDSRRSRC
jgi:hypothetical protein